MAGGSALVIEADVGQAQAAQDGVARIITEFGAPNILAACAGYSTGGGTVLSLDEAALGEGVARKRDGHGQLGESRAPIDDRRCSPVRS